MSLKNRHHARCAVLSLTPLMSGLALAAGTLWSASALAMHSLPTVEVEVPMDDASAFSVAPAQALEELRKTPGGVTLVDAKDYLNGRASTPADALLLAPGVFAQSRFGAEEARISIRGSGLQRTFHGRGIMVLQDGVPINLADGSFDMQALEPQATRYIEVYRGANALRYGNSTLGGAINFVSATGRDAPPLAVRVEAGSFDYRRAQIAVAGRKEAVDAYASLSHFEQEGFREHAAQRTGRFFGNVGVQLSPAIESRFYLAAVDTDSELPGSLTMAQLRDDPRQANAGSAARDQKRDFALYRLANKTVIAGDHGARTELSAYAAHKRLSHPIFNFLEQKNRDFGLGARHNFFTHVGGREQENTVGLSWRRGITEDQQFTYADTTLPFTPPHARGALANAGQQTAENLEAYGESSWQLTSRLKGIVGAQWTAARRKVNDRVFAAAGSPGCNGAPSLANCDNSYDASYHRLSPKLGFIHALSPRVEVFGNVSGSFEPPSFSESLTGLSNAAPTLRAAQKARTFELGTRGDHARGQVNLGWDVALYHARLKDELLAISVPPATASTTINADRTVHQGVEAGLRVVAPQWRVSASYQFNDFSFERDAKYEGNDIAGLPRQFLALESALRLPGGIWAGPTVQAASRSWVDHANTVAAPGYGIYGLKASQTLAGGISWFVDARNLGDRRYAATTGVIDNAAGADVAQFSPGEGRAVYAGVSKAF